MEDQGYGAFRRQRVALTRWLREAAKLPLAAETRLSSRDEDVVTVRDALNERAERLEDQEFTLAVVGEFSTGKSSLLNVLLDLLDDGVSKPTGLLPTNISATTAAITMLRHGESTGVTVQMRDGQRLAVPVDDLPRYLTTSSVFERFQYKRGREVRGHRAGDVAQIEVNTTSPMLGEGICLVDTPGLGSVHLDHRAVTTQFIPRADAILFVLSTDPPMGESEKTFLQYVALSAGQFVFIQTKRDVGDRIERGKPIWKNVAAVHQEHIAEILGTHDFPYFVVSAREAAKARRTKDAEMYHASGFTALERYLEQFLVGTRGAPRLRAAANIARRQVTLLERRAETIVAEARIAPEARTVVDLEQETRRWNQQRSLLADYEAECRETYQTQLRDQFAAAVAAAARESERSLREADPEQLRRDEAARQQAERRIVKTLQQEVARRVQPVVTEAVAELRQAAATLLNKPDSFGSRFAMPSLTDNALAPSFELNSSITEQVVTKQRTVGMSSKEGVGWGAALGAGAALLLSGPIGWIALGGALLGAAVADDNPRRTEDYQVTVAKLDAQALRESLEAAGGAMREAAEAALLQALSELRHEAQRELDSRYNAVCSHVEEQNRLSQATAAQAARRVAELATAREECVRLLHQLDSWEEQLDASIAIP